MNPHEMVLVSTGNGRLHVQFTAAIKIAECHRLFADVRQAAEASELLIDASAYKAPLSFLQRLQMILAFVANLRAYRVAGVIAEINIDPQRLGETMARNRGANVKVFTCLAEASTWLDGARPDKPG